MSPRRGDITETRSRELDDLIFEAVDDCDPAALASRKRAPKVEAALEHVDALSCVLTQLAEGDRRLSSLRKTACALEQLRDRLERLR
jgi:hypothetical protein